MSKLCDFTVHPTFSQFQPQESESAVKNGLRSIFPQATATFLRSKYYIRSNFQNWKFVNLIADSKSLEKTMIRKCLSFFLNFEWNIVKISVNHPKQSKIALLSKFDLILVDNVNFDYVPIKISKKERYFLLIVFSKDFESAIRLTNFQF